MQNYLYTLLFSLLPFLALGQYQPSDSLRANTIIKTYKTLHPDSALALLDEAAAIFEYYQERESAYFARSKAIPYRHLDIKEREEAYLELLKALKKELGVRRVGAFIYKDLYDLYRRTGRAGKAIDTGKEALQYVESLEPHLERKRTQMDLNVRIMFAYQDVLDWESAIRHSRVAIRIGESCQKEMPILLAGALNFNSFITLNKLQREPNMDFSAIVRQSERARALSLTQPNREKHISHIVNIHQTLSHAYLMQQQPEKALQTSKAGVQLIEATPGHDLHYYARALMGLGAVYKDIRLPESWPEAKRELRRKAYVDTALLYLQQGIKVLYQAHKGDHPDLAQAYLNIGYIAFEYPERHWDALGYFHRALSVLRPDTVVLDSLAVFDWGQRALCSDIRHAIEAQRGKLDVLLKMHELRPEERDWEAMLKPQLAQAEALLQFYTRNVNEEALQEVAGEWQFLLGEKGLQWVENQYAQNGEIKDMEAISLAYNAVEQSINARLLGALRSSEQRRLGKVSLELIEEEKRLKSLLANTRKALLDAQRAQKPKEIVAQEQALTNAYYAHERFVREIAEKAPDYHSLKYNQGHPSLSQLQEALDKETALLQYYISNNNIWLFYTDHQQTALKIFDLDPKAPELPGKSYADFFTQSCTELRNALTDTDRLFASPDSVRTDLSYYGHELYKILLLDWVAEKESIQNLVIIPYEKLHYIPFESLITEAVDSKNSPFKDLPYLIKRYAVSYAYSASLWYENKQRKQKGGDGILGFAASYDTSSISVNRDTELLRLRQMLRDLPGARAEIQQLKDNYAGTYFLGTEASEKQFKAAITRHYDVLHLATHGLLDNEMPFASSLALTETTDTTEDNFVFAYELTQMELNTSLVVLSACETGYGKFQHGEGVASLARTFMYAGAPSLVVSLWAVNDKATAELMRHFYQGLDQGLSKPKALQQAKLDYLARAQGISAHPSFWAGFIQLGNTEAISIGPQATPWIWQGLIGLLLLSIPLYILYRWKKQSKR